MEVVSSENRTNNDFFLSSPSTLFEQLMSFFSSISISACKTFLTWLNFSPLLLFPIWRQNLWPKLSYQEFAAPAYPLLSWKFLLQPYCHMFHLHVLLVHFLRETFEWVFLLEGIKFTAIKSIKTKYTFSSHPNMLKLIRIKIRT